MIEIKGKYTEAVVYTDKIEDTARDFVEKLTDHPAFEGVRIAQMPDVHAGNGCNIGTAYPVHGYVNPDHVGVDIGCTISMHRLSTPLTSDLFELFDHRVREAVPSGMEICAKKVINDKEFFKFLNKEYNRARSLAPELINEAQRIDERFISDMLKRLKMQERIFYKSLGTLGGGNHYIEYGEDSGDGTPWLSVHTGSRNFGVKVANHWHTIAANPKRVQYVGYLWGDALKGYLSDMVIAQAYARFNHLTIRDRIFDILKNLNKARCEESIYTTHNYIALDEDPPMLRKGAISAYAGERVCIPFNMRDGIAICRGKGNADWNFSAPHGAGRLMSRAAAKKNIPLETFRQTMEGIFSTSVCEGTLDESPMAYKPTESILRLIAPTVDVEAMIIPKLNIKDNGK